MTKKWSSTASMDGNTKRQASKDSRRRQAQAERKEALLVVCDSYAKENGQFAEEIERLKEDVALTIERCAQVADRLGVHGVADEIRALKDKP